MSHKILFVDDDEFIRKIYIDRLTASGFEVVTAASAREAKEKIEEANPNLVCLDYLLADETGLDVLKWIRQEKKLSLPVLIFSASGQDSDIESFKQAGATEYVQKDHVVPSELVEKIKKYLEAK